MILFRCVLPAALLGSVSGTCTISCIHDASGNCHAGKTFGCSDESSMWVSGNCMGQFTCNGVVNIDCESAQDHNTTCACGHPTPAPAPTPPSPKPPTPPPTPSTKIPMPGPQQQTAIGFELEMFIHYSINTYTSELDPVRAVIYCLACLLLFIPTLRNDAMRFSRRSLPQIPKP